MIETRFAAAVAQSTAAGVPVRYNDESICCRSCYVAEDPNEVFTVFQHGAIEFQDDIAYFVEKDDDCRCTDDEYGDDGGLVEEGEICDACLGYSQDRRTVINSVWFYFQSVESARTFVDSLINNGIKVLWNGSPSTAIEVKLNG